jgi:hypothetical protein
MQNSNPTWRKWAEILARYKAKNLVAWLLEDGEPFVLVGAQMLYFGQPLLGNKNVENLARFLENKEETRAFASFLRKE